MVRKDLIIYKRYRLFGGNLGREIFYLWFDKWTTPLNIARAYHKSNKTHGGDAFQYCKAIKELGYLDKKKDKQYLIYIRNKRKKVTWKPSKKSYNSYQINLNPFFEYLEKEANINLNEFDKYILNFMFKSEYVRKKVLETKKVPFEAIKEVIFDYLRLPLGELKTELLDWWTSETSQVDEFLKQLKEIRKNITLEKFKENEEKVKARRPILPGQIIGNSIDNQIYQLICIIPDSFIEKLLKYAVPKPVFEIMWKNYLEEY